MYRQCSTGRIYVEGVHIWEWSRNSYKNYCCSEKYRLASSFFFNFFFWLTFLSYISMISLRMVNLKKKTNKRARGLDALLGHLLDKRISVRYK